MTYEEAKTLKERLEYLASIWSKKLQAFPKGQNGLTPDHVKQSLEFREAKQHYNIAAQQLRKFNKHFVKTFKREYAKDRAAKRVYKGDENND